MDSSLGKSPTLAAESNAMTAIIFVIFNTVLSLVFLWFMHRAQTSMQGTRYYGSIYVGLRLASYFVSMVQIVLLFLFVRHEGSKLSTVGITKSGLFRSIMIGAGVTAVIAVLGINSAKMQGIGFAHFRVEDYIYYLICIGFIEEVIFRGYLQSRISGIIKNQIISVSICSLLFALLHIPNYIFQGSGNYTMVGLKLIIAFMMHAFFYGIYRIAKSNIVAPTMVHAALDFSPF